MEKVVTHTAVQSLSFHTYSIFLGLKNNNCMSGKSTLFQAKLLWPKWLSGEKSGYHFHLSSPLKGFFYPTSLLQLCFLVLCTEKFQNCPCPPTPKPRQPLGIWIFWKIPQVCWQFVYNGQMPHQLALSVKSPTHQHLFKDFPIRQTVYST